MGKMLTFLLAICDLGFLALLIAPGHHDGLEDAGLVTTFVLLAALVWLIALLSALYRAARDGRGWGWVLALIAFLWVPALPALVFGASGAFGWRTPHRRLEAHA
jgi:hypothetical protein